ncbi:MAG: DUF1641 domain-containing protein [Pseudomonadota bacterium]
MDEALILQKLDTLSNEIQSLKTGVVAELRKDMLPRSRQTGPLVSDCLSDLDQEHRREDLVHFMRNMVVNVETLNSLLSTVKGAMELKNEMEPIAKQILPRITNLLADLDGQYDLDEIAALLRNTLSNVHHFNTAITLLKSGMELKNEIEPMAKLTLPKIIEFMSEISGMLTVAGAISEALKGFKFSPEQAEAMSNVIRSINLNTPNRIGPVGVLKKLYDPKVQETLGVVFMMLEGVGAMVQAHREHQ